MKKLSLLIAMILCVTIGGVYATWTYTQNTDVADEAVNKTMNLTGVAYSGSYGTYLINADSLLLKIDPEEGSTHITSLDITGEIIITFTPNSVAPQNIKDEGVPSTFQFSLSNTNWKYDDGHGDGPQDVISLTHTGKEDIDWGDADENGVFTRTIEATELATYLNLTKFNLDTKVKYDAYSAVLGQGNIILTVSDGIPATA